MTPAHEAMINNLGGMPTQDVRELLSGGGPQALANLVKPSMKLERRAVLTEDVESTAALLDRMDPKQVRQVIKAADLLEKGSSRTLMDVLSPFMQTLPEQSLRDTSPS